MPRASAPENVYEILKACVFELIEDNKRPPTLEEIQTLWSSKTSTGLALSSAKYFLEILVERGELKKLDTKKRKYAPISFHG